MQPAIFRTENIVLFFLFFPGVLPAREGYLFWWRRFYPVAASPGKGVFVPLFIFVVAGLQVVILQTVQPTAVLLAAWEVSPPIESNSR